MLKTMQIALNGLTEWAAISSSPTLLVGARCSPLAGNGASPKVCELTSDGNSGVFSVAVASVSEKLSSYGGVSEDETPFPTRGSGAMVMVPDAVVALDLGSLRSWFLAQLIDDG